MALNYGGRAELVEAVRQIAAKKIPVKKIDEALISAHLQTAGMPDPDLIIRTGGAQRLSGFLTWQSVYAEFYFTPTYWPDFSPAKFEEALWEYQNRDRRFGGGRYCAYLSKARKDHPDRLDNNR